MKTPIDRSVVLITGASAGLGTEFARQLAPRAAALILVARRTERLEALRTELLRAHPSLTITLLPCDLADPAALDAMVARALQEHPSIDVLINNAGMGDLGVFDRADWAKTDQLLRINVVALTQLTLRLLPAMVSRGRGAVLNVSSGFGLEFMPGMATYVASKHYVTALTEAMRIETRGTGVVVSQVCPGPVATEFETGMGNFTGQKVPSFIELDAARCVREALAGFDADRAIILPGLAIKLMLWLGAISPRWIKRWIYRPMATRLRALQGARSSAPTP